MNATLDNSRNSNGAGNGLGPLTVSASLTLTQGYLIFVGTSVFSFIIAKLSPKLTKSVVHGQDNLDRNFDAGGRTSVGLGAAKIISLWTWPTTFLQSSTAAATYGISGALWYACEASVQLFLFSILVVQFRIRAPGAKTFLQVIRARFGRTAHLTYCVSALLTNLYVTALLMLGCAYMLTSLIQGFSVELATCLVAATISTFTFMGGLGAVFYVSYFNTAIMLILIMAFFVKVFYNPTPDNPLGSIEKIYLAVNGSIGPSGNKDNSYLTTFSHDGFIFGVIGIGGSFGTAFVDQSYWQCGVTSRPRNGVFSFILGGLAWIAIPLVFGSTIGLGYLALCSQRGSPLLDDVAFDQGLVAPIVAEKLFGWQGQMMVVILVIMAVIPTASAEVMAVTSILVYDIYQVYLKPFRMVFDASTCILCGRERGRMANVRDQCHCTSMTYCKTCGDDNETRARTSWKRPLKPPYTCLVHGAFRSYNDYLTRLKNWCQVFTIIGILPLTIVLRPLNIRLSWVLMFMGVIVGPAVVPVVLSLFWSRLSGAGMVAGAIGGAFVGLLAWLTAAAFQPGGLGDFFTNTGSMNSLLSGCLVSILGGAVISIVVSLITNRNKDASQLNETWETLRDIDNPLRPWTEIYAKDMGLKRYNVLTNRPSLEVTEKRYRMDKILAISIGFSLTFAVLILWPSVSLSAGVMDLASFTHWIRMIACYGFLSTAFVVVAPIVTELYETRKYLHEMNSIEDGDIELNDGTQVIDEPTQRAAETKHI